MDLILLDHPGVVLSADFSVGVSGVRGATGVVVHGVRDGCRSTRHHDRDVYDFLTDVFATGGARNWERQGNPCLDWPLAVSPPLPYLSHFHFSCPAW